MSYSFILILSVSLNCFFSSFMSSSINVAIPAISQSFSVAPELVTSSISAYVITITSFLLPATAIANKFGYAKSYSFGAITAAIAAFLVPFSPNFAFFLASRVIQGIFNAIVFCTSMAVLSDNIGKEKRGTAIGITTASVYAGLTLSPTIGGFITDFLGWRTMFFISSVGYLAAFLLLLKIKRDKPNTAYFPYFKMLVCIAASVLFFVSLSTITESSLAKYALVLGVLLFIYYFFLESKSKHPLFPIRELINNKILSYALGASICNYMATFAIALLLSMYLQLILGFSATQTGFYLMLQPLLQCCISPVAGKLSNKFSPHYLVIFGMLLSTVAIALLSSLDEHSSLYHVFTAQILAGVGFGIFSAPNTSIVMGSVDRTKFALASGLQALSRNGGMSSCMAAVTIILFHYIDAPHDSTLYVRELSFSISKSFMFMEITSLVGLAFCVLGILTKRDINRKKYGPRQN